MASALQKLFRKRHSKQQVQKQNKQAQILAKDVQDHVETLKNDHDFRPSRGMQPYLTVSSLNSPSSSSSYFPLSSKQSSTLR